MHRSHPKRTDHTSGGDRVEPSGLVTTVLVIAACALTTILALTFLGPVLDAFFDSLAP